MKVLVTGGCGFIGSHLVEHHVKAGDEVLVVDDLSTGNLKNVETFNYPNLHVIRADLNEWEGLTEAVRWADRIYHMAAVVGVFHVLANPKKLFQTNVSATERLLETMIKTKSQARLMLTSSSSVYGHSDKPILSEDDKLVLLANDHPLRGYALTKIMDEELVVSYSRRFKLNYTILRLFNTVGPRQSGQYGMVLPRFVAQACKGEPITVFGSGEQTRSFCDVRDSIAMITQLADNLESVGEVINVGRDVETKIIDLANLVKEKARSQSPIVHLDYQEAYGLMLSDIKQRRPSIEKVYAFTHYKHQWTIGQTAESLIELYRAAAEPKVIRVGSR